MDSFLLITNRGAGSAETEATDAAVRVLGKDCDVEVAATSNPGELDGVLHRAGSRTIVVAGGDGSLHAVVAALYRRHELSERTLGLLPLGTGNDFARSVGLPLDPEEAARTIVQGHVRRLDLMVDELGEVVVNNVHVGASAQASRKGHTWKQRFGKVGLGILGYPMGSLHAALKPPFIRLRIEVDGEVVADMARHLLMVAAGNGVSVGGGTQVTPGADAGDGKVDVMVSFATGPLARFGYVWQLRRGDHHERPDVMYLRGRTVALAGEDFWIAADGEISGPENRRSWRVEPGAWSLIAPAR